MITKQTTVAELFKHKGFSEVLEGYIEESALPEMDAPDPKESTYQYLEDLSILHIIGAYQRDRVIGFCAVMVSPNLHYNKPIATTESLYVLERYRHTGAGLKLIRSADRLAKKLGAVSLFITAPKGSRLETVASAMGYRHSHEVFFKRLDDDTVNE